MEAELRALLVGTASFKVGTTGSYGPSFTTRGPYPTRTEYKTRAITNMQGEAVTSTAKLFFEPTDITTYSAAILASAKAGTLDVIMHDVGDVRTKVHSYQIMFDEFGAQYAIEVYA